MPDDAAWQKRARLLFALLREAGVTEREARLNLFRWYMADPTISSTNDLPYPALGAIIDLLATWKRDGELAAKAQQYTVPMRSRHT